MDRKAEQGAAAQGSDSEVVAALVAARERVARGWCVGVFAQTERGLPIHIHHPEAARWCMDGAVFIAEHEDGRPYDYLRGAIGGPSITAWNDAKGRTQAEVLAMFDKAIALAEAAK